MLCVEKNPELRPEKDALSAVTPAPVPPEMLFRRTAGCPTRTSLDELGRMKEVFELSWVPSKVCLDGRFETEN